MFVCIRKRVRVNLEEEQENWKRDPDVSRATYQTKVTAKKLKKPYQPYYSCRGRPTKEEQAERLRQERQGFQGSGFLQIPCDGDFRSSSIESTKSAPPELVVTESEESEDIVGLDKENEVTDTENQVDVTMADTNQQQGTHM